MSYRSRFTFAALAILMLALLATPVLAHEPAASAGGVKADMLAWIKDAEDKLIQLAEATPDAKYAWQPGKDVRTTGEIFMHVAAANYGIPSFWGVKPAEGFKFETYEKSVTKKADIQAALKSSFAHMEKGLEGMSDADLDRATEFFGMKSTVRGGYMLLLSHAHEHLGQSIAYARMNGVTPPWSAKDEASAKGGR